MAKKEKTVLFYEDKIEQNYERLKKELNNAVDDLTAVHLQALGTSEIRDFVSFINNPSSYLINEFWNVHCASFPKHLDKENTLQTQTGVKTSQIDKLKSIFSLCYKNLSNVSGKNFTPEITEEGFVWSVKKEDFARYLDESKKELYDAFVEFSNTANKLIDAGVEGGVIHLVRFSPGKLMYDNGHISVNNHHFVASY